MSNREMNIDLILPVWNNATLSNEEVVSILRFPDFNTLKNKVTRCARKDEFGRRTKDGLVSGAIVTTTTTSTATTTASVTGLDGTATTTAAAPQAVPVAEEVIEVASQQVKIGAVFSTIDGNNVSEKRIVLNGVSGDDFARVLNQLVNKYSLGNGEWYIASNNAKFTNTAAEDGMVVVFRPLVRGGC